MDFTIRRGLRSDAGAAAELWLKARRAALDAIPAPVHSDDDVRAWFTSHVAQNLEFWIAEAAEASEILGLLVLDDGWIDQLYVDPAALSRGIGSRLIAVAKRERPSGLRLWTFASNTRAQEFYERHGFVAIERTDGSRNEERAPDIQYVWRVGLGRRR